MFWEGLAKQAKKKDVLKLIKGKSKKLSKSKSTMPAEKFLRGSQPSSLDYGDVEQLLNKKVASAGRFWQGFEKRAAEVSPLEKKLFGGKFEPTNPKHVKKMLKHQGIEYKK